MPTASERRTWTSAEKRRMVFVFGRMVVWMFILFSAGRFFFVGQSGVRIDFETDTDRDAVCRIVYRVAANAEEKTVDVSVRAGMRTTRVFVPMTSRLKQLRLEGPAETVGRVSVVGADCVFRCDTPVDLAQMPEIRPRRFPKWRNPFAGEIR